MCRQGASRNALACTYLLVVLGGGRLQELHRLAFKQDLLDGEQAALGNC